MCRLTGNWREGACGEPWRRWFLIFVILSASPMIGWAESGADPLEDSALVSGSLKKWHKLTVTFDGPMTSEEAEPNPFLDYQLAVTFRHAQSRKEHVVPGYYAADGIAAETSAGEGNKWRVHFAPDETGEWTYAASFRMGDNLAVEDGPEAGSSAGFCDGAAGRFEIVASDKEGRDFRSKGALQYVGQRYLRFAETGEFFLKCGADAPENFLAYEDFDGDFKTDGHNDQFIKSWVPHRDDWNEGDPVWQGDKGREIIGALNYLAREGMNAFSFLTLNIDGDDQNVFPYTHYDERHRFDCSRLDQWEIVFEHAQRLGLYLHFKTQEWENQLLLDGGEMGVARRLYYRELIARFGHHLALNWNLGEEIDKATTEQKIAWADYFSTHDPAQHPIVIHNGTDHYDLLGTGTKLTGFSLQTSQPDFSQVHLRTLDYINRSAAAGKAWVVACDEPGDAVNGLRPDRVAGTTHTDARRNGLWGHLMAGGAGLEWYFGYDHEQSDLTCQDWRSRDTFWDICRHALDFFAAYVPYEEMTSQDALIGNPAGDNNQGYCFARPGEVYLVYLPHGETRSLDLKAIAGTFRVRWYDPRNGGDLQTGSVASISGGSEALLGSPPSAEGEDWAVLIEKEQGA